MPIFTFWHDHVKGMFCLKICALTCDKSLRKIYTRINSFGELAKEAFELVLPYFSHTDCKKGEWNIKVGERVAIPIGW